MATIGGPSYTVFTTRGCPQAGVLSPLLWSSLVDELLDRLTRRGILCQGYADDIFIIAIGKYEETLCDIIQTQYDQRMVQGSLNPSKTVIVTFTNRYKLQRMKAITLSECRKEASKEVKYLGITLDSKLSFKTHVDNTIDKCTTFHV